MPRMIFEGSSGELEITSDNNSLIVRLNSEKIEIPFDEALHLHSRIFHQLTEIKSKQRKKLPAWKQLLTI